MPRFLFLHCSRPVTAFPGLADGVVPPPRLNAEQTPNEQRGMRRRGKCLVHADSTRPPSKVASVTYLPASSPQLPQAKCQFATVCWDRERLIFQPRPLHILTLQEANPHRGKMLGQAVERGRGGELGTTTSLTPPQQGGGGQAQLESATIHATMLCASSK